MEREAGSMYDVVVYGSSPAGIAAAVAAGTLGLSVALYEPLPMIGGMGAAATRTQRRRDGGQSGRASHSTSAS